VTVLDANDNRPTFAKSRYAIELTEGVAAGTTVMQMAAVDGDEAEYGRVTYSLASDGAPFAVDPRTGLLVTTGYEARATSVHFGLRSLDYETERAHEVVVVAVDNSATSPLEGRTTVRVTVVDENDNAPVFASPLPTPVLLEDTVVAGVRVAKLVATDADTGANALVTYRCVAACFGTPSPTRSTRTHEP